MKWINYTRYDGDDLGISAEDLLKALSEFFLQSGFNTQYMQFSEFNQHSLEGFCGVWSVYAVMKMNLNLAKTLSLKSSKLVKQGFVILLGRIKISMPKGSSIMIPNGCANFSGLFTPAIQA